MPKPTDRRRPSREPHDHPWWPTPGVTVLPWGPNRAQRAPAIRSDALTAECVCPSDCLRDHENE